MKKVNAIYFEELNFDKKNLSLIKKKFDLLILKNSSFLKASHLKNVEVLFAPFSLKVDNKLIEKCEKLKIVASNTTSIPHIDQKSCKKKNIYISALHKDKVFLKKITPTIEHTVSLILLGYRNVLDSIEDVKNNNWYRWKFSSAKMLSRLQIGILGYGRIGQGVAKVCKSLGMCVKWYDPYKKGGEESITKFAKLCNILSINASNNVNNKHIINEKFIKLMPKNSIIVNTARGELLKISDALKFLRNGHLKCVAIDTIEGEFEINFSLKSHYPKLFDYIKKNNNFIITPHIGGSTDDAWFLTQLRVIEKIIKKLKIV